MTEFQKKHDICVQEKKHRAIAKIRQLLEKAGWVLLPPENEYFWHPDYGTATTAAALYLSYLEPPLASKFFGVVRKILVDALRLTTMFFLASMTVYFIMKAVVLCASLNI